MKITVSRSPSQVRSLFLSFSVLLLTLPAWFDSILFQRLSHCLQARKETGENSNICECLHFYRAWLNRTIQKEMLKTPPPHSANQTSPWLRSSRLFCGEAEFLHGWPGNTPLHAALPPELQHKLHVHHYEATRGWKLCPQLLPSVKCEEECATVFFIMWLSSFMFDETNSSGLPRGDAESSKQKQHTHTFQDLSSETRISQQPLRLGGFSSTVKTHRELKLSQHVAAATAVKSNHN